MRAFRRVRRLRKRLGKPFWTELFDADVCPVYDCCIRERGLEHCGQCPGLICERFTRYREPAIDDELAAVLAEMKSHLIARRKGEQPEG